MVAGLVQNTLFNFFERYTLTGKTIIVGISGGSDSSSLLFGSSQFGKVIAAHVNYGLRGDESDEDEQFVVELAKTLKIECEIFSGKEVPVLRGESTQMWARRVRYNFFQRLKDKHNASAIFVAHTLEDQAETVLLNLLRGTGLNGLAGMREYVGNIGRPFLKIKKQELRDYLTSQSLSWREDSSNFNADKYLRNKLRLRIGPLLEEINPKWQEAVGNAAEFVRQQVDSYLDSEVINIVEEPSNIIELPILSLNHNLAGQLESKVRRAVTNTSDAWLIAGLLYKPTGRRQLLSSGYEAIRASHSIRLIPPGENPVADLVEITQNWQNIVFGSWQEAIFFSETTAPSKDRLIAHASEGIAFYLGVQLPITIRLWQEGDRIKPLGMKGAAQKISDILVNRKIPLDLKRRCWVIEKEGAIAFVSKVGIVAEWAKCEPKQKCLKVYFEAPTVN